MYVYNAQIWRLANASQKTNMTFTDEEEEKEEGESKKKEKKVKKNRETS